MLATSVCVSFVVRHDTFTREVATVASSRSLAFSVREKAKPPNAALSFSAPDRRRSDHGAVQRRAPRARSFTRASPFRLADTRRDSHHVRPRLGCVSRFDARVSRIPPGATPRARDAERRATPVAAANFAFLARLKSRVPRRAGRRGSLLASRRVPLTAVPPLRARAATPRSPKRQTTRSSRSPTSPPRPRRRRRSRPIPASRTKTRRSRR